MRLHSIRVRLTLWYTGLLAITFLILGGITYSLVAYTLYEETDSSLRSVATTLAEHAKNKTREYSAPDVDEIFRRFFGFPPVEHYLEWLDPFGNYEKGFSGQKGYPLTQEAKENALRGIATFETIALTGTYPVRVLTWPVLESGKLINVVRVGMSRKGFYSAMYRFLLIVLILLPVALLFAGGSGWILARRALKPVDSMTETARRIGAGQLDARLEMAGTKDELDRLAETLNDMLGRLDDAFTEMRQFTADASHELQTPLTIIRGEMEVALRSQRSPEEYETVLRSALEEIERISRIVEGLLLLARADAGVLRMDLQPVDLVHLVEEVLDQTALLARKKSIDLIMGNTEPLETAGDFMHLRRLFLNLVDNGIKYTPPGGVIKVSIEQKGETAILSVKDTGPGIPPEEQEKVFQRFFRSQEARSAGQGGSGLGLSIAKSIAEAHGGKLELESTPDEGSVFRVYLPLRSQQAQN